MNKLILSKLGHTWIVDLDGTIVKHNGYKVDGQDTLLTGAKDFFETIPEEDMIILLTSRTIEFSTITEAFLEENCIKYDHIIYGAPYGERILVNDNKPSGLTMAYAVPVNRDEGLDFSIETDEAL